MVCVGTPAKSNGKIDLHSIYNVCKEIGEALYIKKDFHIVVIRSTVPPGTTRKEIIPILEDKSKKSAGIDFGIVVNPEFLREATAIDDFFNPPKIVIGEFDKKSAEILASIYRELPAPIFRTTIETSEMIKFTDNLWHALKICFANEIGSICKVLGIDSYKLMDIFCRDTKLNLSGHYLKPGNVFGGSCLPKDIAAIKNLGKELGLELPLINSLLHSNAAHLKRIFKLIYIYKPKRIGFLGITFKPGTDDVRQSAALKLIKILKEKGYVVYFHDDNLLSGLLVGENKIFLDKFLPDFKKYMYKDAFELSKNVDMLVVTHNRELYKQVIQSCDEDKVIIDLVRLDIPELKRKKYYGICW
jgi:GDP-mannose 6-dehydrogenase